MKIAYLLQCHKHPEQINDLIYTLDNKNIDFYVHIDKKSSIKPKIIDKANLYFIDPDRSINIQWGNITQVDATLLLMKEALRNEKEYDYLWLISGQDFPIKNQDCINDFLFKNRGRNFIEVISNKSEIHMKFLKRTNLYFPRFLLKNTFTARVFKKLYIIFTGGDNNTFNLWKRKGSVHNQFYFGSSWFTLTSDAAKYVVSYVDENPSYRDFYKNVVCPDESFFQTILMNSRYVNTVADKLVYVDWSQGKRNPKILGIEDKESLLDSDYLFARKFDNTVDDMIIEELKK